MTQHLFETRKENTSFLIPIFEEEIPNRVLLGRFAIGLEGYCIVLGEDQTRHQPILTSPFIRVSLAAVGKASLIPFRISKINVGFQPSTLRIFLKKGFEAGKEIRNKKIAGTKPHQERRITYFVASKMGRIHA